jgi:hypothetical protein
MDRGCPSEEEVDRIDFHDAIAVEGLVVDDDEVGGLAGRERPCSRRTGGTAPMGNALEEKLRPVPAFVETEAAMQGVGDAGFAHHVVVFVEGQAVHADRDPAASLPRFGNGPDARAQMHVRRGVRDDGCACFGDHVQFVRPCMNAVGEREARRQEPDVLQIGHDALGKGPVCPVPLIGRLKQVHVDAPAGLRRTLRDTDEKFMRAPLNGGRAILHIDHGSGDRIRDLVRHVDQSVDGERRPAVGLFHDFRRLGR